MKNIFSKSVFIAFFALSFADMALGVPAKLSDVNNSFIGKTLTILEDPYNTLTLEEVIQSRDKFIQSKEAIPNYGLTTRGYWFHAEYINDTQTSDWVFQFEPTNIDYIHLYRMVPGSEPIFMKAGQSVSGNDFPMDRPKATFPFEVEPNEKVEFYFFVSDAGILSFPMKLIEAHVEEAIFIKENMVMGIYFGILIVMILYNLFLYFGTRVISYMYYCIYLFGMIIAMGMQGGYTEQYLWPEASLWWKNYAAFLVTSAFLCFGATAFMASFLEIKPSDKFIYKSYKFLFVYYLTAPFAYAVLPVIYFVHIWSVMSMICFVLAIYAGIVYYLRGFKPARLYLASWAILIAAIIKLMLNFMGIGEADLFSKYGIQFGSAMEAILLALALADRINYLQVEKEEIRLESLQSKHHLEIMEIKQKMFEHDLDKARRIQIGLIPSLQNEPNLSGFYLPMKKVGGDYFDVIAFDPKKEKVGYFISDVSGHGVQAALISVMIKSIIHNDLTNFDVNESALTRPDKLLVHLNKLLYPYLDGNFVSAFYMIYEPKKRLFSFSGAAHPPPIILEKEKGKKVSLSFLNLTPQGPPIGIYNNDEESEKLNYSVKTEKLKKGSKLILYSDGFTDNIDYNYKDQTLGLESFQKTPLYDIFSRSLQSSNNEMIEEIRRAMLESTEGEIADDICALSIEVK